MSGDRSVFCSEQTREFQPIARRLNKVLVRVGALFMLILILVYSGLVYLDISSSQQSRLMHIAQNHRARLAVALWDIDPVAINEELDSLQALPSIAGLVLTTPSGTRYVRGVQSERNCSYQIALLYKSSSHSVGRLTLFGDRSAIWLELFNRILPFFIIQILLLLGILFVLQRLLRRVVVQRLDALVTHTHLLKIDQLENAPAPPVFSMSVQDELDCLLEEFSKLQNGFLKVEQERGQLIHALAESKEQLEIEVAQRTGESLYLSGFLHMLSKDAQRYLDQPLDQVQFGLEKTFEKTGILLGLDALVAICFSDHILQEEVYLWHKDRRSLRTDFALEQRDLYQFSEFNLNQQSIFFMHSKDGLAPDSGEALLCHDLDLTQLVALPLDFNSERLGVLFVGLKDPERQYSKLEMRMLPMMVGLCSNVLAHRRQQLALKAAKDALLTANAQLALQANHDSLTEIANRRAFDSCLVQELRRAMRSSQPLLLIALDVDYFKKYNDHYGHGEGDHALRKIAKVLAGFAERAGDCAARIGGEEFALILPDTNLQRGQWLAERIRLSVLELGLLQPDGLPMTISQGLAIYLGKEEVSPADFLHMADQALYQAKHAGRNQVASFLPA